METDHACIGCRFYLGVQARGASGQCRRYPPQLSAQDSWLWAEVYPFDRCGEFKEAETDERPGE